MAQKGNKNAVKHGLSNTRLHKIWHSMYCRCYYKSTNQYKNYGGRGSCQFLVFESDKQLNNFLSLRCSYEMLITKLRKSTLH